MPELRIGICACTTRWHGELEGKQLRVLNPRLTLTLKEVRIPEKEDHVEYLLSERCHLFLDVDEAFHVTTLEVVYPPSVRWGAYLGWGIGDGGTIEWYLKRFPKTSTILSGIKRIIKDARSDKIQLWLNFQPLPRG